MWAREAHVPLYGATRSAVQTQHVQKTAKEPGDLKRERLSASTLFL